MFEFILVYSIYAVFNNLSINYFVYFLSIIIYFRIKRNTLQLKCYMIYIQISLGRNHDFHCFDALIALTFSALYTEYGWKHF